VARKRFPEPPTDEGIAHRLFGFPLLFSETLQNNPFLAWKEGDYSSRKIQIRAHSRISKLKQIALNLRPVIFVLSPCFGETTAS
jgi:hypothetical protein